MIPRYSRAEMTRVWSDENRYRRWLEVELAVAEAQAQLGMIPPESAATLRALANFDIARIEAIETEVRHDVIAFTTAVAEQVGPEARYLHYGLTSSDVLDTGLALQLGQAYEILAREQAKLSEALRRRALEHRHTPIMGRTHGMHAEPLTLGMKFALWYSENQRNRQRLAHAAQGLKVGKISGAVGAFAHLAPEVETQVCQRLGLAPAPISNQILQRDRSGGRAGGPGPGRRLAGKDCNRNPASAAFRSGRGGRIFCPRAKGLFRHAPQEKPHWIGKYYRSCKASSLLFPGGF